MTYGLVYRINGRLYLSEYSEDGKIGNGTEIDDVKNVYEILTDKQLAVVKIKSYQQDVHSLENISVVNVANSETPDKTLLDLLQEGIGLQLAKNIYERIKQWNAQNL